MARLNHQLRCYEKSLDESFAQKAKSENEEALDMQASLQQFRVDLIRPKEESEMEKSSLHQTFTATGNELCQQAEHERTRLTERLNTVMAERDALSGHVAEMRLSQDQHVRDADFNREYKKMLERHLAETQEQTKRLQEDRQTEENKETNLLKVTFSKTCIQLRDAETELEDREHEVNELSDQVKCEKLCFIL